MLIQCYKNEIVKTSTDSSGGSELNARSNKARMFFSSFKRDKKSAYLQHSGKKLAFGGTMLADKTTMKHQPFFITEHKDAPSNFVQVTRLITQFPTSVSLATAINIKSY